jgi:hypothetical protein
MDPSGESSLASRRARAEDGGRERSGRFHLRRQPPAAIAHGRRRRLYLIGQDRRIAFQGGEGPFGFRPEALARAIERELE